MPQVRPLKKKKKKKKRYFIMERTQTQTSNQTDLDLNCHLPPKCETLINFNLLQSHFSWL